MSAIGFDPGRVDVIVPTRVTAASPPVRVRRRWWRWLALSAFAYPGGAMAYLSAEQACDSQDGS